MKEKDVVKALDWYEVVGRSIGSVTVPNDEVEGIIALLREKDAEIERLNALVVEGADYNEAWVKDNADLRKAIKTTRSEAITEFAERVKLEFYREFDEIIPSIMADKIDQIAKELKGEQA